MDKAKKLARDAAKLAELLGMAPPEQQDIIDYAHESRSRESEAVYAYVKDPKAFDKVTCRSCNFVFAVKEQGICERCKSRFEKTRSHILFCSDECMASDLKHRFGIDWNWNKNPAERWARTQGSRTNDEPLVILPKTLNIIDDILGEIEAEHELVKIESPDINGIRVDDVEALLNSL